MEAWKNFIGKELKIIFEDGEAHTSKKEGKLTSFTDKHLFLETYRGLEVILLEKIIRVEVAK